VVKGFKLAFPGGNTRIESVVPDPAKNLNVNLRRPTSLEGAKRLPDRILNGRTAHGVSTEDHYKSDAGVRRTRSETSWMDPTSKLPVRLEFRDYPSDLSDKGSELIQRDIVFNAPLDRALFSTEPPEGYTVLPDADF
jgi:outer membrane lipoprotein-sorting protein